VADPQNQRIKYTSLAADKLNMSQRPLSWRVRAILVADEISLGCTLLDLANTERELGDTNASCASLEGSQTACDSARQHLGELSCLMQSHREILERSIFELQSAVSDLRDRVSVPASDVIPMAASLKPQFALNRVARAK
jgi:hypothetical protein